MPGHGPPPKDPSRRARRNQGPTPLRVIQITATPQPPLEDLVGATNPITKAPWQAPTLMLWSQLAEFPSTDRLQPAQWSLLARAMMLDDAMVAGDPKIAAEARLQLQKFGVAPDDVARLRIVFAQADEADQKRKTKPKPARVLTAAS